ncbi:MAG TPA: Gfo/Idh/MocA family oxidoreductase [Alphaproteobacteria bacterium]|nr:Gfo/Idh/MocA family oxidoreductase [Alphaproteobacteria bacterium]
MTEHIRGDFDQQAQQPQKHFHVLVLGAGVMGQRHIASMREVAEKILAPRGITLDIAAVDKSEAARAALPPAVKSYADMDAALVAQKPDIALMAFNDDQHISAFRKLFDVCPDLKAVLAEKPLTEHLREAREIEPELRKRYLSMNTVVNFSPVFDRLREELPKIEAQTGGNLRPLGFEAIWGKNRTADTRPSIGVPSESVHALSIIADMFGHGRLSMEGGDARKGYLSTKATDVIYEIDATFRSGKSGVPALFHASYVFESQHRTVTAYYRAADNSVVAAELDFDVKHNGQNADRLRLHRIDASSGKVETLLDEYPDKIVNGAPQGLLRGDRITAFISLSLTDFLTPPQKRDPALASRLSNLDAALEVQGEVEQINPQNRLLRTVQVDADPQKLDKPKYTSIAAAPADEVKGRLSALEALQKPAPPRPAWKPPVRH